MSGNASPELACAAARTGGESSLYDFPRDERSDPKVGVDPLLEPPPDPAPDYSASTEDEEATTWTYAFWVLEYAGAYPTLENAVSTGAGGGRLAAGSGRGVFKIARGSLTGAKQTKVHGDVCYADAGEPGNPASNSEEDFGKFLEGVAGSAIDGDAGDALFYRKLNCTLTLFDTADADSWQELHKAAASKAATQSKIETYTRTLVAVPKRCVPATHLGLGAWART